MSRSEKVKVAMIGAGEMANRVHYPSLASFDDVEIVAICELNEVRLNRTADKYHIKGRYLSPDPEGYRTMISAESPEAVYAIGNPDVMYPVWRWCLEQGLNLYIEKPMGLNVHQARSLAYLADQSGSITQVSFQRRSCPMVVQLHQRCLDRGPITHAVCEFYKCSPEPFIGPRDHMMDDGVHAIDTLRWICGGEVTDIQSVTQRIGVPDINFFAVLLSFDNGSTGVLLNSWTSGRRVFRMQMHGHQICAEAEPEAKGVLYADGDTDGIWYDTKEVAGSSDLFVYGGFQAKNRDFIDAVLLGRQTSSPFEDAAKTMEVAERILALDVLRAR